MTSSSARKTSKSDETRAHLMQAAEVLFAEKGIANVSLREVNAAASQKNSGSVHYHFGSKENLLSEILANRMGELNQARQNELGDLNTATATSKDLLRCLSAPLIKRVDKSSDWQNYALIARELLEFRNRNLRPIWMGNHDHAAQEIYRCLSEHRPETELRDWSIRIAEATHIGLTLIADRAQRWIEKDRSMIRPQEEFLSHLICIQMETLGIRDRL